MSFAVTILGSGAALPTSDRNPTAQLVEIRNQLLLLDCGEGTQVQLRKVPVKTQKLRHIFISHLHGDHYFGLIGLIHSLHLLGRKQAIHLYAIPELKQLIDMQLAFSQTILQYPLHFHPINPEKPAIILDNEQFTVSTIPLDHRIPTCGFLVREKPLKRNIRKDFVNKVKVPYHYFERIRNGEDFIDENGKHFPNDQITDDPPRVRSFAYCTDTSYHEPIIPIIKDCDLLYHEATFMEDRKTDAHEKFHSTAMEAAAIALKAGVKKLVIGHFSARYKEADGLLEEAKRIFPNTIAAEDNLRIELE